MKESLKRDYGFDVRFDRAKDLLEENDGAGNTFKATAKPVLIGTAVVGSTTMIFIDHHVADGRADARRRQAIDSSPPFLLGLVTGGAVIYWFTGAATQAVSTGAYRAVEFIKANIRLEGAEKASVSDSKKVVEICTLYAQKGMFNIFLTVFFSTLAFAFLEPLFFIGYLISIALFGLFQAIFMANAGSAWDSREEDRRSRAEGQGDAAARGDGCRGYGRGSIQGHLIGGDESGHQVHDKFTTLFGLLAVSLAVNLSRESGPMVGHGLSAVFFAISLVFVWRSFYGMRIGSTT